MSLRQLFAALISLSSMVSPMTARAEAPPALRVSNDAQSRTVTIIAGPLQLRANAAYGGTLVTVSEYAAIPVDGWLKSFEAEVVDAQGRVMHQPLLHHAGLFAPGQRDLFSPAMRRIVAFGRETDAIKLPGELGYRVEPSDSVLLLAAFFNETKVSYDSVFLRIRIHYADANRDVQHADVLPLYLDVLPPGNRDYDVPAGVSSRSWDWSPAVTGKILALGGHLHRYGRALILENITTGDTIWIGTAKYDADAELIGVDRKIFWRGHTMRSDHVYRLTAVYDNPTGATIRGAMGKVGGLFLPTGSERHPAVDRTDPAYVRDYNAMVHHTHEHEHVRSTEQRITRQPE